MLLSQASLVLTPLAAAAAPSSEVVGFDDADHVVTELPPSFPPVSACSRFSGSADELPACVHLSRIDGLNPAEGGRGNVDGLITAAPKEVLRLGVAVKDKQTDWLSRYGARRSRTRQHKQTDWLSRYGAARHLQSLCNIFEV